MGRGEEALNRRAARTAAYSAANAAAKRASWGAAAVVFVSLAALMIIASPAFADTLRCGSSLIQPGATMGFVEEKCGAPQSKQTFTEPVMARRPNGTTYEVGTTSKDVWRYKRGSSSFPAVLTFEKGVLTKLEFEK